MNNTNFVRLLPLSDSKGKSYLLLFILWPFLAFITALINYSHKEAKNVVYIFLIYYGLNFAINTEGYTDAVGYANHLKANAALPFSDFFQIVGGLYSTDNSVDIVEPFISFIVSRFTNDYRILFAVFAAVFGFFYLKSINLLYKRYQENISWNTGIHLAFFSVILPVTAINGFRMWTAAWIFFYAGYHVVLYRDRRYLILAMASTLVHWSFLSANLVLIIYYFAGNRNFVYLPLALASFVIPQFLTPFFADISLRFGPAIQNRFESYSNEAYVLLRQQQMQEAAWFLQIGSDMVFYYLLLVIIIVQIKFKHLMNGKIEKNLFSFLLLFLAFVNFGMEIPSFGGRFQSLFFLFATLYVFLYFTKLPTKKISPMVFFGIFPILLYTVVSFRQSSESINAWLFTPGFGLPLFIPGISLYELLF